MKRILLFLLFLPFTIFSQSPTKILSYDVLTHFREDPHEITGNIFVQLLVLDESSDRFTFLVPKEWNIISVKDENNLPFNTERLGNQDGNFNSYSLVRTNPFAASESLFINIDFSATFDSSSYGSIFLNTNEFLLPFQDSLSWLPNFGSNTAERYSLEISIDDQFTLFSQHGFDTTKFDERRIWKNSSSQRVMLSYAFMLCGIRNAVKYSAFSPDSLVSISLFSSSMTLSPVFVKALTHQLLNADEYFSRLTQLHGSSNFSYVVVGDANSKKNIASTKDFILLRRSPVYSVIDSASLNKSFYDPWIGSLALNYCPPSDSTSVFFRDALASYLSMRYVSDQNPNIEKEKRRTAISNGLTFFPIGPIAEEKALSPLARNIVSNKGRYVYLMLEYLLGKDSFDKVIAKMSVQYSDKKIQLSDFQHLCEEEYGSSLGWFFQEWLYRSSVPEYVIQWRYEKTLRGMFIVRVVVDQRGDIFSMPVPLVFSIGSRAITKRIVVDQSRKEFTFVFPSPPSSVELDPTFSIFRWLLDVRISAHAKTSLQYLGINRDTMNAEQEALYTLQLDPNNSTGSAPMVFFVLGNVSASKNDWDKAKEYFMKGMSAAASNEAEVYKLFNLIRYANVIELKENRKEALPLYQRAKVEAMKNALVLEKAVLQAERFIRSPIPTDASLWFEIH